ncbi:MAG: pirin family protein [Bryobacterales bacterium]|nr:pirin family protein [Bryobacterales bacterium]
MTKKVLGIYESGSIHWVGNAFHVRTMFPTHRLTHQAVSPFLLLDYAGPTEFPATERPRGVGEHPHRGFETVTIVYQGKVAHRDSGGNAGVVGPGDVHWMTAASGVVHEEYQEQEFARTGGTMEMVQLWVNLPKAHKMAAPAYQTLLSEQIPVVELDGGAGFVRVIAGEWEGQKGPARTFTPVHIYDLRLREGGTAELRLPSGGNTLLFLLRGSILLNGTNKLEGEAQIAHLDRQGESVSMAVQEDSLLLVLSGAPIEEPVAAYGPFVMNTQQELLQAMEDYRASRMGHLTAVR